MSANRYRAFLLWYFLIILPILSCIFLGLFTLGARSASGILHMVSFESFIAASMFYMVACLWPLFVATNRRMHDLGYNFKDYFFIVSPKKTMNLAKALLYLDGQENTTVHGSNPGRYE